jgi:MYXO-CTERM domain-containing protein
MASCHAGSDCPEPAPEPEPECSAPTVRSYCFPQPESCEDDAECGDDRRCVALPNDWDDDDDAPEGWQGLERACFPEGLALAIEGRVGVEGGSSSDDGGGGKAVSGDGASEGSEAQTASNPLGEGTRDDDHGTGSSAESDGCSVATPGSGGGGASWAFALSVMGLSYARRRRGDHS